MNNKNCVNTLSINGTTIELSDEAAKELETRFMKTPLNEIREMILKNEDISCFITLSGSSSESKVLTTEYLYQENNEIFIYLPLANTQWYFGIIDVIKEFCQAKPSHRYPKAHRNGFAVVVNVK